MIYLLYGEEEYLMDKFINSEIKKRKIELITKYEYPKTSLIEIINDASYDDLFSSKKAIVVEYASFLEHKDDNENELVNYINNSNENTFIFFKLLNKSLDERKKIVNLFKEKCNIKNYPKYKDTDTFKFIKEYLKDNNLTIEPKLINEIISRVSNNLSMITLELDKLILYKEDNIVTLEDIENVISISLETDIFKLVNEITNKNLVKLLKLYNDLVSMGNHPSMILLMIANQFRLIYQVKVLSRDIYNEEKIASILGVHPYQVKLALQRCMNFSESELIHIIKRLSLLDEDIKLGRVELNNSLEPFFIELCNN